MKAVFPCKGVVVLTKSNVEKLSDFYTENLTNSKLFPIYEQSNYSIQIGNITYLPKKTNIVLEQNAHLLTLRQLHQVLAKQMSTTPTISNQKDNTKNNLTESTSNIEAVEENYDKPIDDNFILNHPFFKTLTPLN